MRYMVQLMANIPNVEHKGPRPTPTEAAKAMIANLCTNVLATVMVGGWRFTWCCGFLALLMDALPRCQYLFMVAVKGGPASDDEIAMVCDLLEQLGVPMKTERTEETDPAYVNAFGSECYTWYILRPGKKAFMLTLVRYTKVPNALKLRSSVGIYERAASVPNQRQFAVLSAPVLDANQANVNDQLNKELVAAMAWTKDNMAKKGWMPNTLTGKPSQKEFRDYFELN